jgi:FkbM family methyltransferase
METQIFNMKPLEYTGLGDTNFIFEDIRNSNTVPYVWNELMNNFYGIEDIHLTEDDIIIDIGANVGLFSIYMKKKFGCKVIAFEPVPENFENLKRNIIHNGFLESDFELHNCAITNIDGGEIQIGTPILNSGGSSVFEAGNFNSICKTETIDKYLVNGCSYFKIDCEGCEYDVIPTIIDKLNDFQYIGIEYHQYIPSHDAKKLYRDMQSNFNGLIFSNIGDVNAIWN